MFNYHTDPGHGWLAVKVKDAKAVGLDVRDFTSCSYKSKSGQTLYLEEDCDMTIFWEAWTKNYPGEVFWSHVRPCHTNKRHWVRSLPRIHE